MISQIVISKPQAGEISEESIHKLERRGGRRSNPLAFTEQGVAMLASVLNSPQAILVNIEIVRAFVRLRQLIASNSELSKRLDDLEKKYDSQFGVVFKAIRQLMLPPSPKKKGKLGFG